MLAGSSNFVNLVYGLTSHERFKKDFELVWAGQKKRCLINGKHSSKVSSNSKKDFMKFLDYSRSFIAETISHLYVAFDQGYITEAEINRAKEQATLSGKW